MYSTSAPARNSRTRSAWNGEEQTQVRTGTKGAALKDIPFSLFYFGGWWEGMGLCLLEELQTNYWYTIGEESAHCFRAYGKED